MTPRPRCRINPNGLDTEGIVRACRRHLLARRRIRPVTGPRRPRAAGCSPGTTPHGLALTGTDYPVIEAFPAIYATRKVNRGFEGLAPPARADDLVIGLQSPLLNPDQARRRGLAHHPPAALLALASGKVTAEYAYQLRPRRGRRPRPDQPGRAEDLLDRRHRPGHRCSFRSAPTGPPASTWPTCARPTNILGAPLRQPDHHPPPWSRTASAA